VFLATGASILGDVRRAIDVILAKTPEIVLMQCNTNYTGSLENFRYINLRVLESYKVHWPEMLLGLSDHTPGHATVLGAVAMGARVIEKHFTDDNSRDGPDHPFAMNPVTWRDMVDRTRELEAALGDGIKRIEDNETETAVVQRRALYLKRDKKAGEALCAEDLEPLRPAPEGALAPWQKDMALGKPLAVSKKAGEALFGSDVGGVHA
jgi:sialic acid synthase SpsE